ncbi:cornifelin [Strix aluco]|uniref:cornifelin n=1 Tax=Strix aluco TaxID=111821 RepID=UPI003DA4BD5C
MDCPAACPTARPVLTQPPPAPRSCQALPQDWGSGLCDCWLGDGIGLWGTACPCLLACRLARAAGESGLLPCLPGAMVGLRTLLRQQLRIRGCVLEDWAAVCFCCPCAVCQMARELRVSC